MEEAGELTLHLYPGDNRKSTSQLYTDSGDGYGPWRADTFELHPDGGDLEIECNSVGEFSFPYRQIKIKIHGPLLSRAFADGREYTIQDNILTVPEFHKMNLFFSS
jgi:alpha-glucosidase